MNDSVANAAAVKTMTPVIETMPADLLTPLSVYLKLSRSSSNSFLLESVEGGESLARYSFVGADPRMTARGNGHYTRVMTDGDVRQVPASVFDFLREHFSRHKIAAGEDPLPFLGGAIGNFGFDCAGWFEPSLSQPNDADAASFMFFDSVIAFDHAKQLVKIVSLVEDDGNAESLNRAAERNREIRRRLETDPVDLPHNFRTPGDTTVSSNWSRQDFERAVEKVKELILQGECYQVVLSQCFSRPTPAHPVSIYRAMRSLNPSPYMFLLRTDERSVIGASPEMLVKSSGRRLEYRPIAGTRPRGKTVDEDNHLASEMRADRKEVAEHLMLVDLGRNDLGRVAKYGSVTVDGLMSVERYSHVQHLVSYLSAELREGLDRFDALAACFPAGTVSGAPKVRAIEIIQDMEPDPRGVYAGAVGYFDYGGNMDTCIAIRTLVLENGVAKIQAGAGIVADSVPASEYDETVNKAKALLKAIELAEEVPA